MPRPASAATADPTWEPVGVEARAPALAATIDPDRTKGWLRRLLPLLLVRRRRLVAGALAGALALGLQVSAPAIVRSAIDAADAGDRAGLRTWAIVLVVVAVGRFATGAFYRYRLLDVAWGVETDLRGLVYDHLTRLPFSYYDRTQSGQVISRANSDIRSIQVLLAFSPLVLLSMLSFVFAFVYMLTIHVPLTLVALSTLPGVFLFGMKLRNEAFPLTWLGQARMAQLATVVDESTNGVRVVQSFAQEPAQIGRLARIAQQLRWANLEAIAARARYNPLIEALPRLGAAAVLLYGGWLAIEGTVSIGTLFAFNAYVILLQTPFRLLGFLLLQTQRASAAALRIYEVLDEPVTIADAPGARDLVDPRGAVAFDDVWFRYPSADGEADARPPVLRGATFEIAAGETVALVGRTGSGKSTVIRLLARFYDVDGGAVRIDDNDVREVSLVSLRHHLGLVFDEPFLFSVSLADNIAFGRPGAARDEIVAAARIAQADEFISALPHGYDTVVGERGYTLSGGQRQRVAIARTLLERPPILVFDDATSAIDVGVEAAIHAALDDVLSARTTILIAHRLSTIALADRVIVLEGGQVVAEGTHADLLATEPRYAAILADSVVDDDAEGGDA